MSESGELDWTLHSDDWTEEHEPVSLLYPALTGLPMTTASAWGIIESNITAIAIKKRNLLLLELGFRIEFISAKAGSKHSIMGRLSALKRP